MTCVILGVCVLLAACSPTPSSDGTPSPKPSPTLRQPPTKNPKGPSLGVTEWTWSSEMSNDANNLRAQGLVKNQSSGTVRRLVLYLVLRDAAGRFLGVEFTSIYQQLAPGEIYPWEISARVPLEVNTVEISNILGEWDTETKVLPANPPAIVTEWAIRHEGSVKSPYLKIQGMVKNVATRSLARIQVHVVMRDANGRFLGVESAYAAGQSLAPGESVPWTLNNPEPAGFAEAGVAVITWEWAREDN
ncbi:MAG: FxLYD domain-containing protein [Anaerolineae bacterium]